MRLGNKVKLLAVVCAAYVILLGGLCRTVLGNRPVHAAAGNGAWVQEGGETMERAKGLEGKCVALTFDDGPHKEYTAQLLDGLKERGVRAGDVMKMPYGSMFQFYDMDGNVFLLREEAKVH